MEKENKTKKEQKEEAKVKGVVEEAQAEVEAQPIREESPSDTVPIYKIVSPNSIMMPTIIPPLHPTTTAATTTTIQQPLLHTIPQRYHSQEYIESAKNKIALKYHKVVTESKKMNFKVPNHTYKRILEEIPTKRNLPKSFNFSYDSVRKRLKR